MTMTILDTQTPLPRSPEIIETATKHGTQAKVIGRWRTCWIYPQADGTYTRLTHNGSKHGRRYADYRTYESGLRGRDGMGQSEGADHLTLHPETTTTMTLTIPKTWLTGKVGRALINALLAHGYTLTLATA